MYNIKITGVDKVLFALNTALKEKVQDVADTIEAATYDMVAIAKNNAPKDEGILQNRISNNRISDLEHEFVSQDQRSAWLEWGTKKKVDVPAELQEVALKYKGVGIASGTGAREAIFGWCKRKRIPEEAWYPIYREIVTNGIKPHPFFYPAFNQIRPKLIQDVKEILNA